MSNPSYEYHGLMATYWDLLRGDTSNWSDRFFYLDIIRKHGQPALDVGCSSGRLILDYLSQGIDIDGVDISPEMITLCRQNAARKGVNPNLYCQGMTDLALPRKYQTILVPSSSIQLLLQPGQPQRAMQAFYEHLKPGGALVSPFMTLWKPGNPLEDESTREAVREDGAIVRRTAWSRFDPSTNMEETRDTWEVVQNGKVITSEIHEQSPATLSYSQSEAVHLFEQAGFTDIQVFSEFTFEPVKSEDTLFCVLGIKPGAPV